MNRRKLPLISVKTLPEHHNHAIRDSNYTPLSDNFDAFFPIVMVRDCSTCI